MKKLTDKKFAYFNNVFPIPKVIFMWTLEYWNTISSANQIDLLQYHFGNTFLSIWMRRFRDMIRDRCDVGSMIEKIDISSNAKNTRIHCRSFGLRCEKLGDLLGRKLITLSFVNRHTPGDTHHSQYYLLLVSLCSM